ncbi:MAG TPA: hypothetical protein VGE55_02430 [Limnobacter sp.]|uniref:hypothetical protein n=1 Tax=Limnobacter sp. TaxID=2003368 RepID=UPI002ED7A063
MAVTTHIAQSTLTRAIHHFDGTRDAARPMDRVEAVRRAGEMFRQDMLTHPTVQFYKAMELVRVPYPSKFAYLNAYAGLAPFVHLCNKLFVIQFHTADGIKTLLASPSDWEHQRATPFFAQLDKKAGPLVPVMEALVLRKTNTVLGALANLGIQPEQVDYITYDHLHTQNLTRWLGSPDEPGLFPNAKLLVMKEEWASAHGLIPWQNQWYCPGGIRGIPENRVIQLEGSVFLGDGSVALVRTKGHTEGNHSIVVNTPQGILVTSENGVSLDAYAPAQSRIPGLADYAARTGAEVIINGNTQEYVVDQYISMVQEKAMAGPCFLDPRFPNVMPSSESAGHWLFPGTAPTLRMGEFESGQLISNPALKKAA